MVNSVSGNYDSWITSLNQRGIKTTSLGNGEANFADYTGALSESLKQEIMASFDTQADYDLQARLAGIFGSKSVMQSGDIVGAAKAAGIQVDVQYVNTSYIVDNKADGHYDKDVTNGSIAVYTFKDANGGEIKIADANGNGALETEELFMNELLSGVVSDISASGGAGGISNTQNEMENKINALLEQMQAQIEEQQRHLEEIAKSFELQHSEDTKADDKKENSETKDSNDEVQKTVEKFIRDNYSGLSETQISKYSDEIMDKISETGISIEKAVKDVLDKIQTAV